MNESCGLHSDLAGTVKKHLREILLERNGALDGEASSSDYKKENAGDVVEFGGKTAVGNYLADDAPVKYNAKNDHDTGESSKTPLVDLALGVVVAGKADLRENHPVRDVPVVLCHGEGRDECAEPKHDGQKDKLGEVTNKERLHTIYLLFVFGKCVFYFVSF